MNGLQAPVLVSIIALGLTALPGTSEAGKPVMKVDADSLQSSLTAFALDLYAEAVKERPTNFFFAPISISIGLGMTYAGARNNTGAQMAKAMYTDLEQDKYHTTFTRLMDQINRSLRTSNVKLSVAKAFVAQADYEFRKDFLKVMETQYGSEVHRVDFKTSPESIRGKLNKWVAERTNQKITEMIEGGCLTTETRLVLLNAIHFKASWASEFPKTATTPMPFWLNKETKVDAPTMYQKQEFRYGESKSLQVLELPYANEAVSMVVILPTEREGLTELEKNLTPDGLSQWLSLLSKPGEYQVEVFMPRFKIESDLTLSSMLRKMGMSDLFDKDNADLSGMTDQKDLCLDELVHKAGVDVNEEGTEAWAATSAEFGAIGGGSQRPPPVRVFRADHPFIFMIRERSSGTILFMGRVINPKE